MPVISPGFSTTSSTVTPQSGVLLTLPASGHAGVKQATTVPAVPLRTAMFDAKGDLTRTWIIFFEGLGKSPAQRTLLLKDTTVGNDIADHVTAYRGGTPKLFTGVLRKAITADLTVRVNLIPADGSATISPFVTLTIPKTTPVDTVLFTTSFPYKTGDYQKNPLPFTVGSIFTWDVTASDASTDKNGIASFTVYWKTAAQ